MMIIYVVGIRDNNWSRTIMYIYGIGLTLGIRLILTSCDNLPWKPNDGPSWFEEINMDP